MTIRALHPRRFDFSYGGFCDGYQAFELREGCLINKMGEIISPDTVAWIRFRNDIEALGVFSWDREYYDPDVLDGTQWEINLVWGRQKLSCYGSNRYPPQFKLFLTAVERLSGITF
jgi:hypothetical protein